MKQSKGFSTSDSRRLVDPDTDAINAVGGEPLADSGFEHEDPEPNFDERS